jgi:hypothetical protein
MQKSKTNLREIEDDQNNKKDIWCLMVGRLITVTIRVLSKLMTTFNAIPINILAYFFEGRS